jgi:hypothetical protein
VNRNVELSLPDLARSCNLLKTCPFFVHGTVTGRWTTTLPRPDHGRVIRLFDPAGSLAGAGAAPAARQSAPAMGFTVKPIRRRPSGMYSNRSMCRSRARNGRPARSLPANCRIYGSTEHDTERRTPR